MRKSLFAGLALAAFAALAVGLGELLGFDLQHVALLGAALGGALVLVPHRFPLGKLGGFVLGFLVALVGYGLRAAVLPDSVSGRAAAAFLVVAVIAGACAISAERLPLWSGLLGAAAIVGAYEETYTNAPSQFLKEAPSAATAVLLAAALGYLAVSLVTGGELGTAPDRRRRAQRNTESGDGLDTLLAGESK